MSLLCYKASLELNMGALPRGSHIRGRCRRAKYSCLDDKCMPTVAARILPSAPDDRLQWFQSHIIDQRSKYHPAHRLGEGCGIVQGLYSGVYRSRSRLFKLSENTARCTQPPQPGVALRSSRHLRLGVQPSSASWQPNEAITPVSKACG